MSNHHFEQFLFDSFKDGVAIREMRLSHDEVQFIQNSYPKASIIPSVQPNQGSDRRWYEICLYERIPHEDPPLETMDDISLRTEKQKLLRELNKTKHELERVKQELAMMKSYTK